MSEGNRTVARNAGIDLVKVTAILLVVLSHMLSSMNSYFSAIDWTRNIFLPTVSAQQFTLSAMLYSGQLGNLLFFISSAWFLVDSRGCNKRKILQLVTDIWVISALILLIVLLTKTASADEIDLSHSLMPVTKGTYWYMTCYLLFYAAHPYLNRAISGLNQRSLLRSAGCMFLLYCVVVFYLGSQYLFHSMLLSWAAVYLMTAYMKRYMAKAADNTKWQLILLAAGAAGMLALMLRTNMVGLRSEELPCDFNSWRLFHNPYLIMMAFALFNLIRRINIRGSLISRISTYSMLIYVIHGHELVSRYGQRGAWRIVDRHFGYHAVAVWALVLTIAWFAVSLALGILYRCTLQRLTTKAGDRIYQAGGALIRRIEDRLMKIN